MSVAVAPSTPPVGDLVAEVFHATAEGQLIRGLGRFPVENGGAIYQGPSRPPDQRRAFEIVELGSDAQGQYVITLSASWARWIPGGAGPS